MKLWAKQKGFTIVELLIVIVVIGILAAITIVAYNGIQERARVSSVSSALNQAAKKVAIWQVDYPSTSPTCTQFSAELGSTDTDCTFSTNSVEYQYTAGTNGAYCITATTGPTSYKITESTKPIAGGCAGHGVGGVAAITNLATNPSFEVNTTGWAGSSALIVQSNTWAEAGASSLRITPSTASIDSFSRYGSTGSLPTGVIVGGTYTVSGTVYRPLAQTGTIDPRARGITVYAWNGATATTVAQSSIAPNSAGSSRISTTFTVPAGSTGLEMRFYNGASNTATNLVYWDNVMLTTGTTLYTYADGSSSNWAWNGAAHAATSTGPPL